MGEVTVRAPAKINLHLGVGPLRPDGFHTLATAYQAVSLFSTVTARPAAEWSVACDGLAGIDVSGVPLDESNLALRAARLLAERSGADQPVALHIDKGVPVAGGLAGGSADGAAALLACDTLWELGTPRDELLALAGALGSDVPFALVGGSAAGHGRGELVTPLEDNGDWSWVLLTFAEGMSTPAVYGEYDVLHAGLQLAEPEIPRHLIEALRSGDAHALAGAVGNDLQPASLRLRPALEEPLRAGLEATAYTALVSGSGPTCLFLCGDADHAARVAARLTAYGTVTVARGPAPGAEVL